MPLDNKYLTPDMIDILHNLSYENKVNIYCTKCKGCGYMLIKVGDIEVRSVDEAVDIAKITGEEIEYSCDYPEDIEEQYGKLIYPSLTQIITNGCRFWSPKNIEDGRCAEEKLS